MEEAVIWNIDKAGDEIQVSVGVVPGLRWKAGILQEQVKTETRRNGKISEVTLHWRDVPSEPA